MKRYMLFAGRNSDDMDGGWYDSCGSYATVEIALKETSGYEWWHIVDLETGKIVEES